MFVCLFGQLLYFVGCLLLFFCVFFVDVFCFWGWGVLFCFVVGFFVGFWGGFLVVVVVGGGGGE